MSSVRLGVRENASQVSLLLLVVVFLGAVVGVERSVLPLLAASEFGIVSATATISFLVAFGFAKAVANFLAGDLADRIGRRRILLLAWGFGIPVPLLLMWAPSWGWIGFANVLLGINQGLAWSTTQIMKMDLAGPRRRGLVLGLNECAGYLAVAAAALGAGYLAAAYGPRPAPYLIALGAAVLGFGVTLAGARDTAPHVELERTLVTAPPSNPTHPSSGLVGRFSPDRWARTHLWAANQAGLVNNLKEGVVWGLLPIYFAGQGLDLRQIGWLTGLYPAVWGVVQLGTGPLSDRLGRRSLIVGGLLLQALALVGFTSLHGFAQWVATVVVLGLGTAVVYPTLIAQVSDLAEPASRASAVGRYRLWRDMGYVVGGLLAGLLTDWLDFRATFAIIALLFVGSGIVARLFLPPPVPARAIQMVVGLQPK
ncbi:MAG: MFS transporter [Gemmatimonadetes bacterium]|nr:MFS transporter [Gemmatimonadota bacterium]